MVEDFNPIPNRDWSQDLLLENIATETDSFPQPNRLMFLGLHLESNPKGSFTSAKPENLQERLL